LLSFKRKPYPQNNKKTWNDAIQRYNLPVDGIQVAIPGDYKPRIDYHDTPAPAAVNAHLKPFRYVATRALLFTCGLAALGNIPVYSMVAPLHSGDALPFGIPANGTPTQVMKDLNLPAVSLESYAGFAVDALPDAKKGDWQTHTVEDDDTLPSILAAQDLSKTAEKILGVAAIKQELSKLEPGSHIFLQINDKHLAQLIYSKDKHQAFIVSPSADSYVGNWKGDVFEALDSKVAFTVKESMPHDAAKAGLSKSIVHQLGQIFRNDADFKDGVHAGDKLGVIFEDFRYQGESIFTDKVLAAEYTTPTGSYQRIRFTLSDGKTDYFRPDGDTELQRTAFDRKPIEGGRMSSGFGFRIHPIFGFSKMHAGVDFAAPRGTPIHATADGTIKFRGRQNGYGNMVELQHSGGISTRYGHMSAFNDDFQEGAKVKRGDVIGYVGSTGSSTGNHVHYEFRVDDEPENPLTVELPKEGVMTAQEMGAFKTYASTITQQLTDLRKLATLDKPLKDQTGG